MYHADVSSFARAHDRRTQITLSVLGDRGIAALARDDDGTLGFAGGELTDEQDVIARAADAAPVAAALGRWIAAQRVPRARMDFVPAESGTAEPLGDAL